LVELIYKNIKMEEKMELETENIIKFIPDDKESKVV